MREPFALAIIVLTGCASHQEPPAVVERSTDHPSTTPLAASATAPAPVGASGADERVCAARGGSIQPVCMSGELTCVIRYRDGGKRCSDKIDCLGECLYEGPDPPPPNAAGVCQRTSDPCGCKALVRRGRVEPTLCAD